MRITCPIQRSCLYDEGLDAEAASALEDLDVWNAISPSQPENMLKTPDVKRFKLAYM